MRSSKYFVSPEEIATRLGAEQHSNRIPIARWDLERPGTIGLKSLGESNKPEQAAKRSGSDEKSLKGQVIRNTEAVAPQHARKR